MPVQSGEKNVIDAVIQGCLSDEYMQALMDNRSKQVNPSRFYVCIGKELKSYAPVDIFVRSVGGDP